MLAREATVLPVRKRLRRVVKPLATGVLAWRTRLNFFRRFEIRYLRSRMPHGAGGALLDVACGIGIFSTLLGRDRDVYGCDLDKNAVRLAAVLEMPRARFLFGDAHGLPFKDAAFDVVVSICAIEHFADDRRALAEMRRVLKPGGRLLLTADSLTNPGFGAEFRARHARAHAVVRFYTVEDLRDRLAAAGFAVEDARYLLTSRGAAALAGAAFRLLGRPLLSQCFACAATPIARACELAAGNQRAGVIACAAAVKPVREGPL